MKAWRKLENKQLRKSWSWNILSLFIIIITFSVILHERDSEIVDEFLDVAQFFSDKSTAIIGSKAYVAIPIVVSLSVRWLEC